VHDEFVVALLAVDAACLPHAGALCAGRLALGVDFVIRLYGVP